MKRRPRVGLVMLTWNDAENLRTCLSTLAQTTEPFLLEVVDNGSTDATLGVLREFQEQHGKTVVCGRENLPLAAALNVGFGHFLGLRDGRWELIERQSVDYIGWIHPDHVFEWPTWLAELVKAMDEHPEWAKLGASEAGNQFDEPRAGNTQCFIIRRSALEAVGLFDERFEACGGYEDWEHNHRLLTQGGVMIWPGSVVRHKAMQTRQRHDNVDAAKRNADLYREITGQWEPFV